MTEGKVCKTCGAWKPFSEYYARSESRDGHRATCKECHEKRREALLQNPQRLEAYQEQHRVASRKYSKRYREEHCNDPEYKAKKKLADRKHYERVRDEWLAQQKQAYAQNPEPKRLQSRQWHRDNPTRVQVSHVNWKAEQRGTEGSFSYLEWVALCEKYDNRCLCCGEQKPLTVDHVIPLSLGGPNVIANVQPLCGICNAKKGNRTIDYRPDDRKEMSAL
ncbi:MAG: HNH endonuclease [Bacillota bacterium]|jgi:5-methylcytosine-specific restriction endonuclease McrA|nr:MAG: HNH endonuclease [Bacillota bacterium]